jgi:hypothetical protein
MARRSPIDPASHDGRKAATSRRTPNYLAIQIRANFLECGDLSPLCPASVANLTRQAQPGNALNHRLHVAIPPGIKASPGVRLIHASRDVKALLGAPERRGFAEGQRPGPCQPRATP